jgi:hypothetical protein
MLTKELKQLKCKVEAEIKDSSIQCNDDGQAAYKHVLCMIDELESPKVSYATPIEQAISIGKELGWTKSFIGKQAALVSQGITDANTHSAVIHLAQVSRDFSNRRESIYSSLKF